MFLLHVEVAGSGDCKKNVVYLLHVVTFSFHYTVISTGTYAWFSDS